MAIANRNKKNAPQIVAVIGDGALAGGMAFEALNHAGDIGVDMLVVLNDNKMSISPNVGGLEKYLTKIISSSSFVSVREKGRKFFSRVPILEKFLRRAEKQAKGMLVPSTLFEQLGFETLRDSYLPHFLPALTKIWPIHPAYCAIFRKTTNATSELPSSPDQ